MRMTNTHAYSKQRVGHNFLICRFNSRFSDEARSDGSPWFSLFTRSQRESLG